MAMRSKPAASEQRQHLRRREAVVEHQAVAEEGAVDGVGQGHVREEGPARIDVPQVIAVVVDVRGDAAGTQDAERLAQERREHGGAVVLEHAARVAQVGGGVRERQPRRIAGERGARAGRPKQLRRPWPRAVRPDGEDGAPRGHACVVEHEGRVEHAADRLGRVADRTAGRPSRSRSRPGRSGGRRPGARTEPAPARASRWCARRAPGRSDPARPPRTPARPVAACAARAAAIAATGASARGTRASLRGGAPP